MYLIVKIIRDDNGGIYKFEFVTKQKSLCDFPSVECFFDTFSEANNVMFKLDRALFDNLKIVSTASIINNILMKELNKAILPLI